MEHFFSSKIMSLCCNKKNIDANVDILNSETLEAIRHLPSFRPYVESSSPSTKIALLTNDDYFKSDIKKCLNSFHDYTYMFYKTLHILLGFIQNLPNSPLGKQVTKLYIEIFNFFFLK